MRSFRFKNERTAASYASIVLYSDSRADMISSLEILNTDTIFIDKNSSVDPIELTEKGFYKLYANEEIEILKFGAK